MSLVIAFSPYMNIETRIVVIVRPKRSILEGTHMLY